MANMDRRLGDYFKYNRFHVVDAVYNHASDAALLRMAGASEDELTTWSHYNDRNRPPKWLKDLGWYRDRHWQNVFWYH